MQIERLIVRKTVPNELIIRNIKFNIQGLNLIVDNTKSTSEESGNSVGKTTAVKIIDLCLGAKSVRELYYDSDTKSENTEIKEFLSKGKVQAELILVHYNQHISIKRDLYKNGKRYINDEKYTQDQFWDELKRRIFNLYEPYPTFRQLIPKFVRVSNTSEDRMIKYLPMMTSSDTYETIYSFLFNILDVDLVSKRNALNEQLSDCQKSLNLLKKNQNIISIHSLEQKLELVDESIKEFSDKRKKLSYMDEYKNELTKKRDITSQISLLQKDMDLLQFEIKTINESLNKLSNEKANINIKLLKNIYEESNQYIPKLQKSFDDLVNFHNAMIQNRIDFITEQLNEKESILKGYIDQIDVFLEEKRQITIDVLDEGLLDELNVINSKIESLSIQKGELLQSKKLLEQEEKLEKKLLEQISEIDQKTNSNSVVDKMKMFNHYFSDYSNKLYGEKYFLTYNSEWKDVKNGFPVTAGSLGGVVGTGKKKGMIVAVDFAYLQYAKKMQLHSPEFIIHDKLENTHINQLKTIFELTKEISGQYVLPILRERIDKIDDDYIDQSIILELSEDNKFFMI